MRAEHNIDNNNNNDAWFVKCLKVETQDTEAPVALVCLNRRASRSFKSNQIVYSLWQQYMLDSHNYNGIDYRLDTD